MSCSITTGRFTRNDFETAHEMMGAFMPIIVSFRFIVCIGVETKRTVRRAPAIGRMEVENAHVSELQSLEAPQ